jgi:hypothetical protein
MDKCCHKKDRGARQAFREKLALCMISFLMCIALGYFTFFLQVTTCPADRKETITAKEFFGQNADTFKNQGYVCAFLNAAMLTR